MINRTVLIGRLTKTPELKSTRSGVSVTQFVLAVNRQFTDKSGRREADFISCVAWRKTAENITRYFHKGSLIGIDGRIQTRSYEDRNGGKVYVTEVMVENFSFLESKNGDSKSNAQPSSQNDPFTGNDEIEITSDDLPF